MAELDVTKLGPVQNFILGASAGTIEVRLAAAEESIHSTPSISRAAPSGLSGYC